MNVFNDNNFIPTKFQTCVQKQIKDGKSILLIAPTGLGKTFAVVGDIQESFKKIVYAVPLRALGGDIREAISKLERNHKPITAVIHHGDLQESILFGEEVVVTTYDQVVCGVPGLPLSLPLKAGHAVAGAIIMSRLILDEVHLAWGISEYALSILLAIVDFRKKLGLQTIILTATLPENIAKLICKRLDLDPPVIVGQGETADDEALRSREKNRQVKMFSLKLETTRKGETKELDYTPLDKKLRDLKDKRIYFANTVERIQATYDRLISDGMDPQNIIVLHNRIPRSWRNEAEGKVRRIFGKDSIYGDYLLLTNQVAEAGLDISAPVVISDPAPVDTLVQRAGRCARWFRNGKITGEFLVIKVPNAQLKEWAAPYRERYVGATIKTLPDEQDLTWSVEQNWINGAWGIQLDPQGALPKNPEEKQREQVEKALDNTTFALNLFDRAAQQHKPGEIAGAFREILSANVAIYDISITQNLQDILDQDNRPETSSVSMGRAWSLLREAKGSAKLIRYEEGETRIKAADYIQTGDLLVLPSTIAYLHRAKGLCFGDRMKDNEAILNSEWVPQSEKEQTYSQESGSYQTLLEHTEGVMRRTYERLGSDGAYRRALLKIIQTLEPQKDAEEMVTAIAQIATLAAGFHDLGKADQKWQARAREIDPECPIGLIGRTAKRASHIGFPHTPPGYLSCIRACELMGLPSSANHLVSAIALASVRHHSSLLNPATVDYEYKPSLMTIDFLGKVLQDIGIPETGVNEILEAGRQKIPLESVPSLLPNDDLFPIYALVGRAILMADREDAAGKELEQWRVPL